MRCSPSKYTGDAASSRIPSHSSASDRAGSSGGGLLLLLLALALVASPAPSSAPASTPSGRKPFAPGKPLPASFCSKPTPSRGPWRHWSGLVVYPDELLAFLLILVAVAVLALLCLWVGGAFVPIARASAAPVASAPPAAVGPSPFGDRFAFMSDPELRILWSDADPGESWKSALDRALQYCHGAASDDELLAILRLHPRARQDRNWALAVRRLIDSQSGTASEVDWSQNARPVCRFFVEAFLHPEHDRAPRGRLTSEEVSPTF